MAGARAAVSASASAFAAVAALAGCSHDWTVPHDAGGPPECGAAPMQPPVMIDVGSYCIDATEVTRADYAAFVAAKAGDTSGQPSECAGNTTYDPSMSWPPSDAELDLPVIEVDWCDATMYCRWAGKRLCGRIGGGPIAIGAAADATQDAWYAACSGGGSHRTYPYGNTYRQTACNSTDSGHDALVPVGTLTTCEGGFDGLMDMAGNVQEWEDACVADTEDADCLVRGGSYQSNAQAPSDADRCDNVTSTISRTSAYGDVGFRCCAP